MTDHPRHRSRNLAAVLCADLVGYSRLAATHEEHALRLLELFQVTCRGIVEQEGGRVVKFIGDATLATFPGAAKAVRAALLLRREFAAAEIRVGLHLGDVTCAADGDVYGDGVNLAFRLEQAAAPGQLLASEDLWRQVRQRSEFRFVPEGEWQLKGAAEPVAVYSVAAVEDEAAVPDPLPPHPPNDTGRRRRWLPYVVGGLGLILSGGVVNTFLSVRASSERTAELDENLVAVVPFTVPQSTPELASWGEQLADVLTRNLDGMGPLRTVPLSTTLARWAGRGDRAAADSLARRIGAGLVIYGNVVASGPDSSRVVTQILDMTTDTVIGELAITVADPEQRMAQLSDSLTFSLLKKLGEIRPIGAVRQRSLAALTTVASFRDFLRAEQYYRRSTWDAAIAWYERALEADSTFAPALWRLGAALGWQGTAEDSLVLDYHRRAGRHNRGLSERDSLLIAAAAHAAVAQEAFADTAWRALEHWRAVDQLLAASRLLIHRYPYDPDAWYTYGDAVYHFGYGRAGVPENEILRAFDRAIALDSAFAPGYIHPIELGFKIGGREMGLRYARGFLAHAPAGLQSEAVRILTRLVDPAHARSLETQRILDSASQDALLAAANLLDHWPDSLETAARLREVVALRGGLEPAWRRICAASYLRLANQLSFRGHLRAGACALGTELRPGPLFATLAFLGGVPRDSARATFDRLLAADAPEAMLALPWWNAMGDTLSIRRLHERATRRARAPGRREDRLRATYDVTAAAAYLALARGDSAGALARFEALPDSACFTCSRPDRLIRVRLYMAQRQYRAAHRLLIAWHGPTVSPIHVLMEFERARAAEQLGQLDEAAAAYRYVADAWARADPVLQPYTRAARSSVERLSRRPR